jgi:hypothetical protein
MGWIYQLDHDCRFMIGKVELKETIESILALTNVGYKMSIPIFRISIRKARMLAGPEHEADHPVKLCDQRARGDCGV